MADEVKTPVFTGWRYWRWYEDGYAGPVAYVHRAEAEEYIAKLQEQVDALQGETFSADALLEARMSILAIVQDTEAAAIALIAVEAVAKARGIDPLRAWHIIRSFGQASPTQE